jgi:hypothetical protein
MDRQFGDLFVKIFLPIQLQAAIAISLKFAHCNFECGFIFLICPNDCIYRHLPRGTFVAKKKRARLIR